MSIQSLTLNHFRNLANCNINFAPSLNLIIGDNGSGKSSLLESIFFLGHGKSFRTSKLEQLIQIDQDNFVVSAKDDLNAQLGVQRGRQGDIQIRINGDSKYRLSDLAKHVAVQVITPETFRLFFGGPKERRKFVDLGLFHVEQSFVNIWRDFKKVLVQRNACLKQRIGGMQLAYYNQVFCQQSDIIAQARSHYVEQLATELNKWLAIIMPQLADNIVLQYQRGWSKNRQLAELLTENYQREIKYGYSLFGAHKFDVQFSYNKQPIEQILSRGQQKLFLMALTIAQANLIYQSQNVAPIILIDDIGAELDKHSRAILAKAIGQLTCQLFITAIEQHALEAMLPEQTHYKMFHVKHGVVTEITQGEKHE